MCWDAGAFGVGATHSLDMPYSHSVNVLRGGYIGTQSYVPCLLVVLQQSSCVCNMVWLILKTVVSITKKKIRSGCTKAARSKRPNTPDMI